MAASDAEIGRRIAEERQRVSMSQRDLARAAQLSQPTIQRIEAGERNTTTLELSVIAEACGVPIVDLLGTNTLADEMRCAGRTDEEGAKEMADYLRYSFGLARRLDQFGVPEVL